MKSIRLVLTTLFLGFLAVSLTTCGGGGNIPSSSPLASISLSPVTPVGATQQFAALGTFSDVTIHDVSPQVTWASSNTSVATINSSGRATSVSAGTATITAASGSISGSTTLTVTSATLSSITVTPATPSIPAGTTQQFIATGGYSDGISHDVSLQATWASSNTSVATINSSGRATSVSAGTATITATSGSISGSTTLTVISATLSSLTLIPANPSTPVGVAQQFIAAGTYSDGTSHDITTLVTWTSLNTSVATVTNSGQATSVAAGTALIVATTQANYFPYLVGNISGVTNLLIVP